MALAYTLEALVNVRSLRTYILLGTTPNGQFPCAHAGVLVSLEEDPRGLYLRCAFGTSDCGLAAAVPLPRECSVDRGSLTYTVRKDHVEVKLRLAGLHLGEQGAREHGALSSEDTEALSGAESVRFFCRACSAPLLAAPLRRVVEMPPPHWHEMAEQWFCGNCCGGGERAQRLVERLQSRAALTPGSCLVGPASCVLHPSDGLPSPRQLAEGQLASLRLSSSCPGKAESAAAEASGWDTGRSGRGAQGGACDGAESAQPGGVRAPAGSSAPQAGGGGEMGPGAARARRQRAEAEQGRSGQGTQGHKPHSSFPCSHGHGHGHPCSMPLLGRGTGSGGEGPPPLVLTEPPELTPGKGRWQSVRCACSAVVGLWEALPGEGAPGGRGVHLLKHRIATAAPPGCPQDVFRGHSLEAIFAAQLQAASAASGCFRFLLRGLSSRAPLAQLSLLSCDAWAAWGLCPLQPLPEGGRRQAGEWGWQPGDPGAADQALPRGGMEGQRGEQSEGAEQTRTVDGRRGAAAVEEEEEEGDRGSQHGPSGREDGTSRQFGRSVKLMFRTVDPKCAEEEVSKATVWAKEQRAEDLYIPESEGGSLLHCLELASLRLPSSCHQFQGYSFALLRTVR